MVTDVDWDVNARVLTDQYSPANLLRGAIADTLAGRELLSDQLRLVVVAAKTRDDQQPDPVIGRRGDHLLPAGGGRRRQALHAPDQVRPDLDQLARLGVNRQLARLAIVGGDAELAVQLQAALRKHAKVRDGKG